MGQTSISRLTLKAPQTIFIAINTMPINLWLVLTDMIVRKKLRKLAIVPVTEPKRKSEPFEMKT